MTPIEAVDAYLADSAAERLEEFVEFLRIPSIGVLSAHHGDVRAGAEWLAEHMRAIGLEHVEVSQTGGHPVVYADWLHAEGAPTVIVYAPLRRPAGRPARGVGAAALRAAHRGGARLRPRRCR